MPSTVWLSAPLLALLLASTSCKKDEDTLSERLAAASTNKSARNHSEFGYFQTEFQDESQFIVQTILTDLAEMAVLAKTPNVTDSNAFSIRVTEKPNSPLGSPAYAAKLKLPQAAPLTCDLLVKRPIWAPEVYLDVLEKIGSQTGLNVPRAAAASENTVRLLETLLDARAETIERENQTLSAALEKNFLASNLHEQAALLLGAFALRENSGDFFDRRTSLCRITAHLAFAAYLRGKAEPAIEGRLAEALLYTLMNNQTDALQRIDALKGEDPPLATWRRTLRAYNTADYRPLTGLDNLKPIERIAWFSAYSKSVDGDVAWGELSDEAKKGFPDFARIANSGGYSVETGHELLRISIPLEIREASEVYKLAMARDIKEAGLVESLNQLPERCFGSVDKGVRKPRVIGWGHWACSFKDISAIPCATTSISCSDSGV